MTGTKAIAQRIVNAEENFVDGLQEAHRSRAGWQCPECYGVRITAHTTRFDPQPTGFQCAECGCQFGSRSG